jgi:hypothetical protein
MWTTHRRASAREANDRAIADAPDAGTVFM